MKRPKNISHEGKTPAIGDYQARALLQVATPTTLRGLRDRALLAILLYHGLRRAELCMLRVVNAQKHLGVKHLQVHVKGCKIRYVPLHTSAANAIEAYLEVAGYGEDRARTLFRPVSSNTRSSNASIMPDGVYKLSASYAKALRINIAIFGPNALRATAAISALVSGADIANVQN